MIIYTASRYQHYVESQPTSGCHNKQISLKGSQVFSAIFFNIDNGN